MSYQCAFDNVKSIYINFSLKKIVYDELGYISTSASVAHKFQCSVAFINTILLCDLSR